MEFWNQLNQAGTIILLSFIFTVLLVITVYIFNFFRDRKLIKSVTDFNRGMPSERELVLRLRKKVYLP